MIRLFRRKSAHPPGSFQLEGVTKNAIETGRARLVVTGAMFVLAFALIAGRMVDVSLLKGGANQQSRAAKLHGDEMQRADIIDRNGILLATSLPSVSLYARPHEIRDPAGVAQKIVSVLPNLSVTDVAAHLATDRGFIYLMRNLTPRQQYDVNALGIPGLYFQDGEKRVFPQGSLAAQVVGLTDLDNKGIAGIEKKFDKELKSRHEPLRLSVDLRVQTVLHDELARTMGEFNAIGAAGIVLNVHTGEVLAMSSLPDYDPNDLGAATPNEMFNRATLGVYEMGSTFKLFTAAAALDSGAVGINSTFDATHPIKVARFQISDDHAQNRWLSIPEILIYSSNIGAAKMALQMGTDTQKAYLARFGMLKPAPIELPEVGSPLVPQTWREINTMTIAFGHGLAVTPIQEVAGISSLVNGGVYHEPTLLAQNADDQISGTQVIKPQTSAELREMMRMVVTDGTGKFADVPGYDVGGKTGTAEKSGVGGYHHKLNLSSFVGAFPINDPQYLVLAMIDEPHGNAQSHGYATAGWNAAPAVGRIIAQIGPMLGVKPHAPIDLVSAKSNMVPNLAATATSARRVAIAATE